MNVYEISYKGMWLGGKAIVIAGSKKSAIKAVKKHPQTIRPENIGLWKR